MVRYPSLAASFESSSPIPEEEPVITASGADSEKKPRGYPLSPDCHADSAQAVDSTCGI
jgi:hypothetical protein